MITVLSSNTGITTSLHDKVYHVVDSTNKNTAGFKYVYDVYVNSVLLARLKNSPYGSNKYGIIDVGSIIRSQIQEPTFSSFSSSLTGIQELIYMASGEYYINYQIKYGEEVNGVITPDLVTGNYRANNFYNRNRIDDVLIASDSNVLGYLTNRPQYTNVVKDEPIVMSGIVRGIDNVFFTIPGFDTANYIGTIGGQDVASFIFKNATQFTVTYGTETSPPFLFETKCHKYKPYTLIFINSFGAFDSFTFISGMIMNTAERKHYEKNRFKLVGSSMVDTHEGAVNYANTISQKIKLTSDYLSTAEYKWLAELIYSPYVYLWQGDATPNLLPVTIKTTDYELTEAEKVKNKSLEVTIEIGRIYNTQYR